MVRRSVPDFELTVAGMITEDGRDWLASARQRYDFSGINVVGNVSREQKRALLQSAWLYLQPSRYEAFGVAMVEALACGTPAVHSQGGALPEIAATGGIPVDGTCSPEKLAEAIVQTLASAGIVGDMAEKARARSLVFRRDAREEALESAFRSVLGDAYPIRGDGRST